MLEDLKILKKIESRIKKYEDLEEDYGYSVQNKLFDLQNPAFCQSKKKLLCNFEEETDLANAVRMMSVCLFRALSLKRPAIFNGTGLFNASVFETFFLPISQTCSISNELTQTELDQIVILNVTRNKEKFQINKFLKADLSRLYWHADPFAWLIGQFNTYIMRSNKNLQSALDFIISNFTLTENYFGFVKYIFFRIFRCCFILRFKNLMIGSYNAILTMRLVL